MAQGGGGGGVFGLRPAVAVGGNGVPSSGNGVQNTVKQVDLSSGFFSFFILFLFFFFSLSKNIF